MSSTVHPKPTGKLPLAPAPETTAHRPVAQVNANFPPQDRQRVRRACEGCRKKKIKCNGEEPCQRCISHGTDCFFADYTNHVKASEQNVEKLENRVASIEQLFKQFLDRFTAGELVVKPITKETEVIENPVSENAARAPEPRLKSSNRVQPNTLNVILEEDNDEDLHFGEPDPAIQSSGEDTAESSTEDEGQIENQAYADGFGELDVDTNGQLRYVGLGSTASVVDTCVGLRRHINKGLERKGYSSKEAFFTSPEATSPDDEMNVSSLVSQDTLDGKIPPSSLVTVLIEIYSKELAFLFPIIDAAEISHIYEKLLKQQHVDIGFAAILFSILAVAAPLLPPSHPVLARVDLKYRDSNMGAIFYNLALPFVNSLSNWKAERKGRLQDVVIAMAILSVYLAETGSQAEGWILIGRAIRLGQDLGLHRSPERLQLPRQERSKRRYIWWCLYTLERQLSTALGRPLSIDDDDCDVEVPCKENDGQKSEDTAGFISLIHLNKILGTILKTVNSVKNAGSWREVRKYEELRERVRSANNDLQAWAKDQVPQSIKTAKSGTLLVEKNIALSSFFSAVILLHRVFMPNPHRESPLSSSQAHLECVKASTKCIRGTDDFLRSVSKTHYLIFHGQNVFISAVVLLQCIRTSNDPEFVATALEDVKNALEALRSLEGSWTGARKCRGIVEEYLEFTVYILESDRKGVCNFEHGPGEECGALISRPKKRNRADSEKELGRKTSPTDPPSRKRRREASSIKGVGPDDVLWSTQIHSSCQIKPRKTNREASTHSAEHTHKRRNVMEVPQIISPESFEETHFDEVVGSSMGSIPHHAPSQHDPFFATFDFDFNNAGLPLLGTDFWQFDQNVFYK